MGRLTPVVTEEVERSRESALTTNEKLAKGRSF